MAKTCHICGAPVSNLERWCSTFCEREDTGPGFGCEDDECYDDANS